MRSGKHNYNFINYSTLLTSLLDELIAENYLDEQTDIQAIHRAYRGRAYHNLDHLSEMLQQLSLHPLKPADEVGFSLALLYHDFVYRAGRKDNEERSATVLSRQMIHHDHPPGRQKRAKELIMATRSHRPSPHDDGDEALLIDLDMAVLARPREGYENYAAAIRKEFRLYPGFLYRRGRLATLRRFMDTDYIYHTDYGRTTYEDMARRNIGWEIIQLGG